MSTRASADVGNSLPVLHAHEDQDRWIFAAVADIAAALQAGLQQRDPARLLVSGGSTPAPVYQALARQPLDWAKVVVALVDERWLPINDSESNARLVRETLLTDNAAAARFESMLSPDRDFEETVIQANRASAPATVIVLGMGADGHTASLFPHMRGLEAALSSPAAYIGVDASGCSGAQSWPRRISLTPAGMANAAKRILLLRGQQKLDLLQRALAGDDAGELPIRAALRLPGSPLQIHWCP